MVLHYDSVSRGFGRIAHRMKRSARSSPIEVVPNRVQLLGFGRHDDRACRIGPGNDLNLRWALRLERDSQRLVNGGKMEVDATVAFTLPGGAGTTHFSLSAVDLRRTR
jgi:hypothetical protein